jgi:hypothetical protein
MIGETNTDTLMKTLHKSLTIAFLAVSIFILGLSVDFAGAQNTAAGLAASRPPADLLLSRYLKFSRLTSENGLSNVQIRGIAQDNHGFMWFATSGGLNRYDGAGFRIYRHDPDDPSSLSRNLIRALAADQSGLLWIGTWGGGLNQGTGSAASYRSSKRPAWPPPRRSGWGTQLLPSRPISVRQ